MFFFMNILSDHVGQINMRVCMCACASGWAGEWVYKQFVHHDEEIKRADGAVYSLPI